MRGCATSAVPSSYPLSKIREKTPSGISHVFAALIIALPINSLVPGWAGCAFTITGQPAAKADAVSPPATEKASGKLLAPNIAVGPNGICRMRKSARGIGSRSGKAGSILAPIQSPARTTLAKSLSCPMVRPRSPLIRPSGSPLSAIARVTNVSPSANISSAIVSRNTARFSSGIFL